MISNQPPEHNTQPATTGEDATRYVRATSARVCPPLRMELIVSARPFSHECFNVELNIRIQLELAIAARRECCTNSEDERAQRSHHSDARPTMGGGSRIASVRFLLNGSPARAR